MRKNLENHNKTNIFHIHFIRTSKFVKPQGFYARQVLRFVGFSCNSFLSVRLNTQISAIIEARVAKFDMQLSVYKPLGMCSLNMGCHAQRLCKAAIYNQKVAISGRTVSSAYDTLACICCNNLWTLEKRLGLDNPTLPPTTLPAYITKICQQFH